MDHPGLADPHPRAALPRGRPGRDGGGRVQGVRGPEHGDQRGRTAEGDGRVGDERGESDEGRAEDEGDLVEGALQRVDGAHDALVGLRPVRERDGAGPGERPDQRDGGAGDGSDGGERDGREAAEGPGDEADGGHRVDRGGAEDDGPLPVAVGEPAEDGSEDHLAGREGATDDAGGGGEPLVSATSRTLPNWDIATGRRAKKERSGSRGPVRAMTCR